MLLLALGCSEEELPAAREPAPPDPLSELLAHEQPAAGAVHHHAGRSRRGHAHAAGTGRTDPHVRGRALAQADIVTTGESFGFDAVLHPMQCSTGSYFVMIDGQGRIVWYEPSSVYFQGTMNGYEWSQTAHTVLSVGSPDYTPAWGEQEGFARQHNASLHGDSLWLFDNQSQRTSRAVQLQLNPEPGTLRLQGAWSFDDFCEHQGGAIPIEGGVLATCANRGLVWAFHEEDPSPSWTLQAHCDATVGLPLTRAIPVFIP
jgi:hypothetical protein